ncbi:hypothetical protein PVAND_015065 [Polypedilum vanderplanki]|uniref:C2H2-type domain-containing protein n=1 Tax=Polypedilum vanderplanki TaxID=319348 RepID=A0A9J6BB09_POLVA|nr:hypothetical protein PVAND_015065 [Polypedilum vanderplanki]
MIECILCLSKTTKTKSTNLSEKVNENLSLYDAIQQQINCENINIVTLTSTNQFSCLQCFKAFKSFYELLDKVNEKHPKIKKEQPESYEELKTEIFVETPINFENLSNIKVEPEILFNEIQSENKDDSDFDWQMEDEKPKKARTIKKSQPRSQQYLKLEDRTPEILASGKTHVTINGKKFVVPKTQLKSNESDERVSKFLDVKCELCGSAQPTFLRLIKHFRKEHKDTKPFIRCCEKKFYRRGRLLDHLDRHDDQVTHKCPHCQKSYKSKHILKVHLDKIHLQMRNECICSVCGRSLKSEGALKNHMYTHEEDANRTFECYICKKGNYKNEKLLRTHFYSTHNPNRPLTTLCHICSAPVKFGTLKAHLQQKHTAEFNERVQCEICDHWIIKGRLDLHKRKHLEGGVNCKICGKFLKSSGSLYSHMKIVHEQIRNHACNLCDKKFYKEQKLKEHVAVKHTREFLFKCRVPTCGKEFRAEANWKMHEKRQHPEEYLKFFAPTYIRGPKDNDDDDENDFDGEEFFLN